jgi:hypothetical protein
MKPNAGFLILKILKAVVLITLFVLLITWVTMGLWNFVMPDIFNLPHITWMQAAALLLLVRLLVGGGQYGWNRARNRWQYKMGIPINKHWSEMSEEEKLQVKRYWKQKCSGEFTGGLHNEQVENTSDTDTSNP